MATVTKDFKVKAGLIVEGTSGTINGSDIITEDIITGGTQTNIAVTYNPGTKTLDFVAENGVADSTTDDLVEGSTNQYFTDARAKDSAAALLTTATMTNISITGTGNGGLVITAENGVADSTTDDLDEGTTNLYYTDARARAAVSVGDGLDYNSTTGVFTADLGNGLQFDVNGQIEINDSIVATDQNLSDAITAHDVATGVHGVTGNIVGTSDVQTLTNKTLGTGTDLSADLDAATNKIVNLGLPTQATDAATKAYVDDVAQGLHVKEGVDAATYDTLANISGGTVTYDNGTLGVGATLTLSVALTALDGFTLTNGDRVLIKDEAEPAYNGIYVRTSSTVFTRDVLFDSDEEIEGGDFVFVVDGTINGSTGWVQSSTVNNVGVDDMVWIQFSGAGTYSAGFGLNLTGTEFSVDTADIATTTALTTAVGDLTDYVDGFLNSVDGTTVQYIDAQDAATLLAANGYSDALVAAGDDTATPQYLALNVNDVAKQVAATTGAFATLPAVVYSWPKAQYRSAEFLVKVAYGTHTEISKILLTLDTADNIAITEYAIVGTNGSLSAISATVVSNDVQIIVTPGNDSTVNAVGTLLV